MRILLVSFLIFVQAQSACFSQHTNSQGSAQFTRRIIKSNLKDPWDIVFGKDNKLWVTESKSYLILRVDAATGRMDTVLDLSAQKHFTGKPWPQGGLMGMAQHPDFMNGKPFVYLAFVSDFIESRANSGGNFFRGKIVKYRFDAQQNRLGEPEVICDTIPGSNDHNGGRLHIARMDDRDYLFYSVGDMGAGQFDNAARPNHAQNLNYYEGKILRFNTEPDQNAGNYDRWIPDDNPHNSKKQSAVYTLGHRNPQGISSATIKGKLRIYAAEHGPYGDDELNYISKGKNYGHPLVIGYADGNYNGLAAGVSDKTSIAGKWHSSYPFIEDEKKNATQIGADFRNPMIAFASGKNDFLRGLYEGKLQGQSAEWPAEAPSGIEAYTAGSIPGWQNSILVATLKGGRIIRLKLSEDGEKVIGEPEYLFTSQNRYRDIAISPDGRKIYLITDRSAVTSGPTKEDPMAGDLRGAIIEMEYKEK